MFSCTESTQYNSIITQFRKICPKIKIKTKEEFLILGSPIGERHNCVCGKNVTEEGWHGFSCLKSAGRFSRHSNLNAFIKQSLSSTHIPSVLERGAVISLRFICSRQVNAREMVPTAATRLDITPDPGYTASSAIGLMALFPDVFLSSIISTASCMWCHSSLSIPGGPQACPAADLTGHSAPRVISDSFRIHNTGNFLISSSQQLGYVFLYREYTV